MGVESRSSDCIHTVAVKMAL